jgi:MFS family permease
MAAVELRVRHPMLHLHLLGERLYLSSSMVTFFSSAAFLGMLFVVPLLAQDGHHLSALTSGSIVFPEAIGVMAGTQVVSRIYARVGPRRLLLGGMLGVAVFMALLALFGGGANLWVLRGVLFLAGFANSFVFQSAQTVAFAVTSRSTTTGRISSLYSTQRQIGAALGVALLSTVITAVGPVRALPGGGSASNLAAYQWAFAAAAVLTLVGAAIALAVRDRDALSTMRPTAPSTEPEEAFGEEPTPEAAAS